MVMSKRAEHHIPLTRSLQTLNVETVSLWNNSRSNLGIQSLTIIMVTLCDKNGKPTAYLHHHAILHPESFLVTGLILGHYVYGIRGQAKGKYFKHLLYNVNGEIV